MKGIKAFIHRSSIADVVYALKSAGFVQMSFIDVQGTLKSLSDAEREYSLEIGQEVITAIKLELFCEDAEIETAIEIIRKEAITSQPITGWLYVSDTVAVSLESSLPYG